MQHQLLTASPRQWVEKTNISHYAQRQAQSCTYLEELFARIEARAGDLASPLSRLSGRLVSVHQRQYRDLAQRVAIPSADQRTSFYFEQLYAAWHLSPVDLPDHLTSDDLCTILAIQGVSYLRGQDRYAMLRTYEAAANQPFIALWQQFYQDATTNAEIVFAFLPDHYTAEQVEATVAAVIAAEDTVMRAIWRHNQVMLPTL